MTSKEMNMELVKRLPEMQEAFLAETSWQEGYETGSHVVCGDVLVPFIKEQVEKKDVNLLGKTFKVIEELIELDDEYVKEVITLSVLESLIFEEDFPNQLLIKFAKPKTLKMLVEMMQQTE